VTLPLLLSLNVVGLKVALVEKFDFSSGTSSRSTKLIHGGVRYLQKAILGFDVEQYRMVKEALAERGNLCQIAPHLAHPLPIMLPVYRYLHDTNDCPTLHAISSLPCVNCYVHFSVRFCTVLFGLKFADKVYYRFKSSQCSKARLQSSKIPAQNRI